KPRRAINVAGTTSPALATRVRSSKITSTRSTERDTRLTGNASQVGDEDDVEHRHRPSPGRLFRGTRPASTDINRWIEAKTLPSLGRPDVLKRMGLSPLQY